MTDPIGTDRWAIADGYIPAESTGPEPEMESHDTVCLLNAGDRDATVTLEVFFTDREPAGPYEETVPAGRTEHIRFNGLEEPEPVPRGTPFACVIESDEPVVCQQTRLDSRQAENALLSTIAHADDQ